MGQYNPNQPLAVGNEFAPVLSSPYTPDLFVERGWSFRQQPGSQSYSQASMFVDEFPAWSVPGHAYLVTVYRRGQETNTGPMKTVLVPLTRASSANIGVGGGAPTTEASIMNPSDGWYTRFRVNTTGEAYMRLRTAGPIPAFLDEPALKEGKRIVDVSILYTASAETGNEEPVPFEINHYYAVRSERVPYGNAEVDLREPLITSVRRSRWGEINTWYRTFGISPFTDDISRVPWNYNYLTLFETGSDFLVEFRTASAAQEGPREINLHYAAMQITYCEENRLLSWGVALGADYDLTGDTGAAGGYRLGRNTQGPTRGNGLGTPNGRFLAPGGGSSGGGTGTINNVRDLTVTLKRADYGPYNNQGDLPLLRGLRTVDLFPGHPGVVINNTIEPSQVNQISTSDLLPQIVLQDNEGPGQTQIEAPPLPFGHTYGLQEVVPVSSEGSAFQEIVQTADAPDTEFPRIRFWARSNEATAPLRIAIETPGQGPVTVAELNTSEFETFPEIADGWRQIDITVDPALFIDDDGTVLSPAAPRWESDTSLFKAWEVLGMKVIDPVEGSAIDPATPSQSGIGTYGDEDAEGGTEGDTPATQDIDIAVVWGQEMPTITGLTVTEQVQPLSVVDPECPVPEECIPTGIRYLALAWTPIDSGFAFVGLGNYELQRRDETMDAGEWEAVATPIHPFVDSFNDYEARVGVESTYRIRYVHINGMSGPWSVTVGATVAAPGVVATDSAFGVLALTSNVNPDANLTYIQTWGANPSEDFNFVEAGTQALQRMYGRDYQVAFRPTERGGVAFSRTLLVNAAAVPVETLRNGFTSLRDLAWADLPYVCVRTDTADRWLMNVNVPSGTVQRSRTLYVASVDFTEVSDTPFAVSDTVCEGMTARGALPSTVYEPRFATTAAGAHLSSDDLGLRVRMRLDHLGQHIPLIARNNPADAADPALGWRFELSDVSDTLSFTIANGASATFTSDPIPFGPGEMFWVRFDYDMDGGGATSTGQFFTSTDGIVWTPLTTTTVNNNPISASVGDSLPLTVGAVADGAVEYVFGESTGGAGGWNGVIGEATVLGDGNDVLADPVFSEQDGDTTTFTDSQGNRWNVSEGICTVDRRL